MPIQVFQILIVCFPPYPFLSLSLSLSLYVCVCFLHLLHAEKHTPVTQGMLAECTRYHPNENIAFVAAGMAGSDGLATAVSAAVPRVCYCVYGYKARHTDDFEQVGLLCVFGVVLRNPSFLLFPGKVVGLVGKRWGFWYEVGFGLVDDYDDDDDVVGFLVCMVVFYADLLY